MTNDAVIRIDTTDSASDDPFVRAAVQASKSAATVEVTVPTADWHPYLIARRLAALDKISAGRITWRPVDTNSDRLAEAVEIVEALLVSWRPGAVVNDRAAGVHVDTDLVVPVRFSGKHFSVDSPLDVCPGPQGVVPRSPEEPR